MDSQKKADFDLAYVWENSAIPIDRDQIVNKLNNTKDYDYMVVNYKNVHLDRFMLGNQEYNILHKTLDIFNKNIVDIKKGENIYSDGVLKPLISVSSFYYGQILFDPDKILEKVKIDLDNFPKIIKKTTYQKLENKKSKSIPQIKIYAKHNDIYMFYKEILILLELFTIAYFSKNEIYYPGMKWFKGYLKKFNLDQSIGLEIDTILLNTEKLDKKIDKINKLLLKI